MGNLINESTKINTMAFKPVVEIDLEWFEREALKKLFLNRNTTLDLDKATFGKAFERVSQYVVCNMSHEVDYVADIGYNGIWQPFSGSAYVKNSVSITSFDENTEVASVHAFYVSTYMRRFRKDQDRYVAMSELGVEPMELTEEVMSSVYENGLNQCDLPSENEMPGDEQENVKITKIKETTVNGIDILASKEYVLTGEYQGKKFEVVLFACDENKSVELIAEPKADYVLRKGMYDIRMVEGFNDGWWR